MTVRAARIATWLLVPTLAASAVVAVHGSGSSAPPGPPSTSTLTATPRIVLAGSTSARLVPTTLFGMFPAYITDPPISEQAMAGVTPSSGIGTVSLLDNGGDWMQVQPTRGAFQFDALHRVVDNARARGIRSVHLILIGTPRWASSAPSTSAEPTPGYSAPPANLADWVAYVRAVATEFKGQITSYQVWSEANLPRLWRGTTGRLAEMTRLARATIRGIDAQAAVVAPSTTVRLGDLDRWYRPFLRELRTRGWPVDAFSAHFYPAGSGGPLQRQALITAVKKALVKERAPRRPLWDGEINYGVAGPSARIKHVVLDNAKGAAYVARTYLDSLRFGVSRVYWSAWVPRNGVYGITLYPGYIGPKALRTSYGWLAGKWFKGCTRTTKKLVTCKVTTTASKSGPVATIVWSEGRAQKVVVPRTATRLQTAIGSIRSVRPGSRIRVTGSPVWLGR